MNAAAPGSAESTRETALNPLRWAKAELLHVAWRHGGYLPPDRRLRVNARVRGQITAELRTDGNQVLEGASFADCDPVLAIGRSAKMAPCSSESTCSPA